MPKLRIKALAVLLPNHLVPSDALTQRLDFRRQRHDFVQCLFHPRLVILNLRGKIIHHLVQTVDRGGHAGSPQAGALRARHYRKVGDEDARAISKIAAVATSCGRKGILEDAIAASKTRLRRRSHDDDKYGGKPMTKY